MSDNTSEQGRPNLTVVSEETPPPSEANDALVLGSAIIAALAGVGFAVGLALGTSIAVYGSALAIGLLALGFGVRRYFSDLFPDIEAVEPRHPEQSTSDEPVAAIAPLERRSLLRNALIGSAGVFGLGIVGATVPSLGPAPGDALRTTDWRRGTRLVTTDGEPIRADNVASGGGVATVWPEGSVRNEISAVILVRVGDAEFEDPTNLEWVVNNELVAYSKVCTHAGCPVGLFRETDNALFCPCHQSTFDAVRGAIPTFGPAARALPQLPLGTNGEGFLIALGDFSAQVGPAYG